VNAVARRSSGLLWLLVGATGAAASAQTAAPGVAPLFVAIEGMPAAAYVQQEVMLQVRIGVDRAWFRDHGVALFQQALEQPFHVVVPWLQAAEDRAVELVPPPPGARTQRLAIGDRVLPVQVDGERQIDGRAFELLLLRCRWLPLAPGRSAIAPVQVRYAFAERFEQDFLRGRTPLDRQETTVLSAPGELVVQPLPKPAPPGFAGAVGEFVVRLRPVTAPAVVGSSLTVQLEVTGSGNLERFAPLPPPALDGFHVQGVTDHKGPAVRRFTLDVLPLRAGARTLPPIPFVAFDPQRASYVTLRTDAVPLTIAPAAAPLPARVQELVELDAARLAARAAWPGWVWATLLGVVLVLAFVVRALAHRRLRQQRQQRLLATFWAAYEQQPAAALMAFDAVLAAALDREPWSGPDGFAALGARGMAPAAVAALQELRQQLDGARFGGAAPARERLASALAALPR
jgi:hypothetical protein